MTTEVQKAPANEDVRSPALAVASGSAGWPPETRMMAALYDAVNLAGNTLRPVPVSVQAGHLPYKGLEWEVRIELRPKSGAMDAWPQI